MKRRNFLKFLPAAGLTSIAANHFSLGLFAKSETTNLANPTSQEYEMPKPTATSRIDVLYFDASVPVKTITLINNTGDTVYPIIRAANSNAAPGGGALYDPHDPLNEEYRGYIGYVKNKKNYFGLPPSEKITVTIPLVFWDAGRVHIATNGATLCPAKPADDPNNPYRFRTINKDNTPTARFIEQLGDGSGLVMWYHAKEAEAPTNDAPDQLVEMTFRDKYLGSLSTAPYIPPSEKHALVNYDLSYVDTMLLPVAIEATDVPYPSPPPEKKAYGWIGAKLTVKEMQDAINEFTFTKDGYENKLLGKYFGGKGYTRYFIPPGEGDGIKIPAGSDVIANSPLNNTPSSYVVGRYMLESGGTDPVIQLGQVGSSSKTVITFAPAPPPAFFAQVKKGWQVLGADIVAGTKVDSVNVQKNQVILDQPTRTGNHTNNLYTFITPVTDYVAEALINLWYSWAQYYIENSKAADNTYMGSAISGSRVLTITDLNPMLVPGMGVSGAGIADNTTILAIVKPPISKEVKIMMSNPASSNNSTVQYKFTNGKAPQVPGAKEAKTFPLKFDKTEAEKSIDFASNVYQVLSAMGTIPLIPAYLVTTQILANVLGCSVGKLPDLGGDFGTINTGVTNMIKSLLRGVVDFNKDKVWYPDPSVQTGRRPFNVYNLNPFVWFVHKKLNLSGYGFSVDDDTGDVGADGASKLAVSIGGTAGLPNTKEHTFDHPFGVG